MTALNPRWRKEMYGPNNIAYLGGTNVIDVGTSISGSVDWRRQRLLWLVWGDAPFHWETFNAERFARLKPHQHIHDGMRLTPKRLSELRTFVKLFAPEFWAQVEELGETLT